jgi:hypothetical protein
MTVIAIIAGFTEVTVVTQVTVVREMTVETV